VKFKITKDSKLSKRERKTLDASLELVGTEGMDKLA
jgi:hypothetical protein